MCAFVINLFIVYGKFGLEKSLARSRKSHDNFKLFHCVSPKTFRMSAFRIQLEHEIKQTDRHKRNESDVNNVEFNRQR